MAAPRPAVISTVGTNQRVGVEERVFMGRRIRDVAQAPDDALFVLVDDRSGDLLRLSR